MEQIRRKFDKMLFEGQGKQLLWLSVIIVSVLFILLFVGWLFGGMKWQDILALFMDPGNFSHPGGNDFFRIITALLGAFLFSALLISVFTNIFDNVSTSYRKGESKYPFNNHILIIGSSKPLKNMLSAIRDCEDYNDKNILVMTAKDVEKLRSKMEIHLDDSSFINRITYFHRERNSLNHLKEACADKACLIYIIGEDGEIAHDALNMRCLNILREICNNNGSIIPCYLVMEMHTTLSVFNYIKHTKSSRLNVEVINESDYAVERLLTGTDFLPALTKNDFGCRLRIVIVGNSETSCSFATIAAQICHYPNFKGRDTRTVISLIGYDLNGFNDFVCNYSNLFDLCHYSFISSGKAESYAPQTEYGDFMDIEWEFIDGQLSSPLVRSMMHSWAENPTEKMVVAMCFGDDETNAHMALHLPRIVYDKGIHIAVRQDKYTDLMEEAASTDMFGRIYQFGNSDSGGDPLFRYRTVLGKRVNRVYDIEYGNPPARNEDEAWSHLPYAHKVSSIASANSIPLKLRCFNIKPTVKCIQNLSEEEMESLSETEHRRWMVSVLLMGYRAATRDQRKDRSKFKELKNEKFVHLDIAPIEELADEVDKDTVIANNIPYILTGEDNEGTMHKKCSV